MKKEYLKPEAEIISFVMNDAITADDDEEYMPGLDGSIGGEEW